MDVRLTRRQQEIQRLLDQGLTYGQIAERLGIRLGTVKTYLSLMRNAGTGSLSERQLQVARYLAEDLTYRQVAESLGVRETTVKAHVAALMRRAGVTTRMGVVRWLGEQERGALPRTTEPRFVDEWLQEAKRLIAIAEDRRGQGDVDGYYAAISDAAQALANANAMVRYTRHLKGDSA